MNNRIMNKIEKRLKKTLDRNRFEHTKGVMYTAAALAMCYGVEMEDAMLAGLLHDCAKCIPNDKKQKLADRYHLDVSESECANPSLLHAKLGALIAAKKYKIKDQEIINAISCHTTGKPGMTVLEKIIYVADYIEPGRCEAPNLAKVRKLAFTDLDECLYTILEDTLVYLRMSEKLIDPLTEKTYLYYKEKLGR